MRVLSSWNFYLLQTYGLISHINTHRCAKTNLIKKKFFRLACIKHALSIHSEPGSNSSLFEKI